MTCTKTLSNLLVAVRSMDVTVNMYINEVLPEAITVTSTMPSDSSTMYMSCSNHTVWLHRKGRSAHNAHVQHYLYPAHNRAWADMAFIDPYTYNDRKNTGTNIEMTFLHT